MISAVLTVFYDGQFYVGIYDRTEGGKLSSARVIFGAEPKNGEIYDFTLKNYYSLPFGGEARTREAGDGENTGTGFGRMNPKRMIREAARQIKNAGRSTRSQQALQEAREKLREEKSLERRETRELEEKRRRLLKEKKKKEKHRGR